MSDAEKDFEIDYVHDSVGSAIPVPSSPAAVFNFSDNLSPIFKESPCKGSAGNNPGTLGDIVQNLITAFKCSMSQRLKEQLLNYLYKLFVIELGGMHGFIPICAGRFSGQKFKCHENIAARRTCFMVCHSALRDEKMAQLSGFATSARTYVSTLVKFSKISPTHAGSYCQRTLSSAEAL